MSLMLLLSAVIIGLSLGLLGAGGSILTVPALTLLLGMDEKTAVTSSLMIVGLIAVVGALKAYRRDQLNKRILFSFGLVSLPFAAIGAQIGIWMPTGGQTLLLIVVMVIAALNMLINKNQVSAATTEPNNIALLTVASAVGLLTGIVGVGGGFLIVPALLIFAAVNMTTAVANSLVLIMINSISAFLAINLSNHAVTLNWVVILTMAVVGACAVLAGQNLAARLPQQLLKRGFALILIGLSIWLIIDQFIMR